MMRDSDGVWYFLLSVFGLAVHDDFGGHTYIYTIGLIWVADFVVEPALCLFYFFYLILFFTTFLIAFSSWASFVYRAV